MTLAKVASAKVSFFGAAAITKCFSDRQYASRSSVMELTLPQGRFCGKTLATFGHQGVRLTETVYSPGLKLPRHSHERACFIFVIKGSFAETYGNRSRDCGPLSLIYRPVGEVHSDHFSDLGGRCLNI